MRTAVSKVGSSTVYTCETNLVQHTTQIPSKGINAKTSRDICKRRLVMRVLTVIIVALLLLTGLSIAAEREVIDLSTLGKAKYTAGIEPTDLSGIKPIVYTPSFSISRSTVSEISSYSVYTPSFAVFSPTISYSQRQVTVFTPPIALFGGA